MINYTQFNAHTKCTVLNTHKYYRRICVMFRQKSNIVREQKLLYLRAIVQCALLFYKVLQSAIGSVVDSNQQVLKGTTCAFYVLCTSCTSLYIIGINYYSP